MIDREEAIKTVKALDDSCSMAFVVERIGALPIKAWPIAFDTKDARIFMCSNCRYRVDDIYQDEHNFPYGEFNYCPWCGAEIQKQVEADADDEPDDIDSDLGYDPFMGQYTFDC